MQETLPQIEIKGCRGCHSMALDASHNIDCVICHSGSDNLSAKTESHEGLIRRPAHPDNMEKTCGQCHPDHVRTVSRSLHFTLKNETNRVRKSFGADSMINSLTEINSSVSPDTPLALADDALRRRCLRCHPYTSGDNYPAVYRGTGCSSCHLQFYEGKLVSHSFLRSPADIQCLQCHYGNRVGFDYYGRYEHDMNDEYRTPYTTANAYFRPYGMEYHQLTADIHQQRGMVCVDCHSGNYLMGGEKKDIGCEECHERAILNRRLPANVTEKDGIYILSSQNTNSEHIVPIMVHPAHSKYGSAVACQVCHAQWAFNDSGTNLLRSDVDDYEDFARLTVQGSSEIEKLLLNNLDYDAVEVPHGMTDKVTGQFYKGVWYKGFVIRRWEHVNLGRDESSVLQVTRPALNISLSWIDEDEEVRFDGIRAKSVNGGMLPYVPHTTGKAGLFYENRIEDFFKTEGKIKE